jgi:hypothetical protein
MKSYSCIVPPFILKDATAGSNPGIPVASPTAAPDEIPNRCTLQEGCSVRKTIPAKTDRKIKHV